MVRFGTFLLYFKLNDEDKRYEVYFKCGFGSYFTGATHMRAKQLSIQVKDVIVILKNIKIYSYQQFSAVLKMHC